MMPHRGLERYPRGDRRDPPASSSAARRPGVGHHTRVPYTLPDSPPGTTAPDHVRVVQVVDRPGIIDLSWGHPDVALLPVAALRAATADAFDRYGPDALSYGRDAGPPPLVEAIRERLAATDSRVPAADEIVVTAGASHALDLAATLLTAPGDVVLVEEPTYHLAVRVLRDHPVDLVSLPFDGGGLRTDAAAETIARLRGAGRRVRMLYTIPTYHNPTGVTLDDGRRREVVDLAAEAGVTIVEDDVYRELGYDGSTPPSLWSLGAAGTVVRLGSFSKTIAPGLRLGYLTADAALAARAASSGVIDSGGGIAHLAALTVAAYVATGAYPAHVDDLRRLYRARRDALLAALAEHMPGASWTQPRGGFFTWVTLPNGLDAAALLPAAEARGVSYVPGRRFYATGDGGRSTLRLAFTRYAESDLAEGARRIAAAARDAGRR
jgi:DNA-binding transcriptional MocR family regulator